jgi:para-nitrobenzyl esterase
MAGNTGMLTSALRWLAVGCCFVADVAGATSSASHLVVTEQGAVQGVSNAQGREFLGIPYAAPPVGALRWQPPQPAARRQETLLADHFANNCPQFGTPFGLQSFNEDCLFLNVYTPRVGSGLRKDPVMVWIHPGAFQFGESNDWDPRKMVDRGVVVVTINYRLGALGFLAHPALSAESRDRSSGNYGLMDQQAALRWVRRNIARFGGDPNNVTLFGESAGGLSVHAQLASPQSKGLFDRAIVQSGAYSIDTPSLATAEATGLAFGAAVGCTSQDAQCLRHVPVPLVLANQIPTTLGFLPNTDNRLLPLTIRQAFAQGKFNRVSVIEGSTHDEFRLFLPLFFDFVTGPLTANQYPGAIALLFGITPDKVAPIVAQYPLANYASPSLALGAATTDGIFACNMQTATQLIARHVPTWVYEFNDQNAPQIFLPPVSFPYGAAHESELQYLFDVTTTLPPMPLNADQERLSRDMVSYWTNFSYSGTPNGLISPLWIRFNALTDSYQTMVTPRPQPYSGRTFARDHKCTFWTSFNPNR